MKLKQLKNKLYEKGLKTLKYLKKNVSETKQNTKDLNELKIIGVTGSKGKTSTCVLIHEYLKMLGYKSILYSSSTVDSPLTFITKDEAYDVPVRNETALLNIINEAEEYGADFLVLEVNDSALEKGFLKDVDFDVRVLTNLNPKHNLENYEEGEYVNLKKSFFKDINESSKCIIGIYDYGQDLLNELLELNKNPKYLFTNKEALDVYKLNKDGLYSFIENTINDLDGLKLKILLNGNTYDLETKLLLTYNAMNILCAVTTIDVLGLLDINKFQECIYDITIPGRCLTYKVNDRLVVIDTHLGETLQCLKDLQNKGLIHQIKVVTGSIGTNFKTWDERFKTKRYLDSMTNVRKFAMNILKKYADFVYLTENDNASENVVDICNELQLYLNNEVPSLIIRNRERAIKKAITESKPNDVIFISGRGNKSILCTSKDTMKLLKDQDVVKDIFKKLKWK